MSKLSVFISYSHRDADLARELEKKLESLGLDAFNPERDLHPGDDWRKATQAAIKRSDAVVLIASPHTLSSSWTSYEAGMAEALGKRVMVLLPNRHSVSELPEEFAGRNVLSFDPQAPEQAAQDIASRLAAA
jgi:hypothetical protein